MAENLALEDPDLDAADTVSGVGGRLGIIDIAAKRVERHAPFTIPFGARDLGAAEPSRTCNADSFRAKTQRRLNGALHRTAERNPALELVGNRLGDELGIDLRLADLDDVQRDVAGGHRTELLAQLLDVGALLADDHARTSGVDRN